MRIVISRAAADKEGLTLADVYAFADGALGQGIDPRTPVRVRTGFRAQLTRVEVAGESPEK